MGSPREASSQSWECSHTGRQNRLGWIPSPCPEPGAVPGGDPGARGGDKGPWGGCPHALTHGRGIPAPRCPRLPSEPPQECGNLTRAGSAGPARGPGTSPPSLALGGPARGWQPPSPAMNGAHTAQCNPCPPAGPAPPDPQSGKEEEDPSGQDVPQETPAGAGWGREEALPPGLVPSHTSEPLHPGGAQGCAQLTRTHTPLQELCVHTQPGPGLGPGGCCPPPTVPHPRSHSPAMGSGRAPSLPSPPRSPAAAVPVYGDGAACPALPAPGRGLPGHRRCRRLCRAWQRCWLFPAVRDHPEDARPVLGTAAGNPGGEKSWMEPVWHRRGLGAMRLLCVGCGGSAVGVSQPSRGLRGGPRPGVQVCHKEPREESSPGPDPLCRIAQRRATL